MVLLEIKCKLHINIHDKISQNHKTLQQVFFITKSEGIFAFNHKYWTKFYYNSRFSTLISFSTTWSHL
jgi:hypothetical protein